MFETGDFQTPAPPESGVADNAVASTPQDHWLYNELVTDSTSTVLYGTIIIPWISVTFTKNTRFIIF